MEPALPLSLTTSLLMLMVHKSITSIIAAVAVLITESSNSSACKISIGSTFLFAITSSGQWQSVRTFLLLSLPRYSSVCQLATLSFSHRRSAVHCLLATVSHSFFGWATLFFNESLSSLCLEYHCSRCLGSPHSHPFILVFSPLQGLPPLPPLPKRPALEKANGATTMFNPGVFQYQQALANMQFQQQAAFIPSGKVNSCLLQWSHRYWLSGHWLFLLLMTRWKNVHNRACTVNTA